MFFGSSPISTQSLGGFASFEVTEVTLQYAAPISDVSAGNWTTEPLYEKIDESSASESDYISSPSNPSNSACEIKLGPLTEPTDKTSHVLRYRYRKDNTGGTLSLKASLYCGATLIKEQTHTNVQTDWVDGELALSEAEANNITDYSDLRIKLTANLS